MSISGPQEKAAGLSVTVYGVPAPQGSTRAFMRPGMRHPVVTADCARTKPWRQAIVDAVREQIAGRRPFDGPVSVALTFFLPRPGSAAKRIVRPAKRPDLDKLQRATFDALTAAGVWRDDSQVTHVVARKAFAGGIEDPAEGEGVPRVVIAVEEEE